MALDSREALTAECRAWRPTDADAPRPKAVKLLTKRLVMLPESTMLLRPVKLTLSPGVRTTDWVVCFRFEASFLLARGLFGLFLVPES